MTLPWFLFYGRMLHMSKREILATRYGEMLDLIACLAIAEGRAKPKRRPKKYSNDEALALI